MRVTLRRIRREQPAISGRLLTADEIAERWHVSRNHVLKLAREGVIPSVHLGRYVRFHPATIAQWEAAQGDDADR